jgi:hypothetical protein
VRSSGRRHGRVRLSKTSKFAAFRLIPICRGKEGEMIVGCARVSTRLFGLARTAARGITFGSLARC